MLDIALGSLAAFVVICVTYYNVVKKKKGAGGCCSGCSGCKHREDCPSNKK